MKSIDLKMTSVEVKTETRPLCAQWTRALATDLQSMYGMDHVSKIETALMKEWRNMTRTSSRRSKVRKIYES
jgi:hypothetical protein